MQYLKSNNKGMVLALSLIIITIITIVAGTFLILSQNDLSLSRKSEEHLAEFYLREAAMTAYLNNLYVNSDFNNNISVMDGSGNTHILEVQRNGDTITITKQE